MPRCCRASLLLGALSIGACMSPEPADPSVSGESEGPRAMTSDRAAGPPPVWDAFSRVQAYPPAAEPFISEGHLAGRYEAEVRVNPEARQRYLSLVAGQVLPAGTLVAKLHRKRSTREPGPIFAMEKLSDGSWDFIVADPDGRLKKRGHWVLCARCHAEAVADSLFGLPARSDSADGGR